MVRTTKEDSSSRPKEDNSVKPNVETQLTFDGFPTGQQDDEDDLLKPDPNFKYPAYQRYGKKAAASKDMSMCPCVRWIDMSLREITLTKKYMYLPPFSKWGYCTSW